MKAHHLKILFVILSVISQHGYAQKKERVLPPEKMIQLVPQKIETFHESSDPKSKLIQLGNLQYSMVEKNFAGSQKRTIKILLFDYKDAPLMYNQATRKWSTFTPIESDSLILRPAVIADCIGWETYHVHRNNSQILLGICNRFFLNVEANNVDLESLKKIVQSFKFETYPK